MLSLKVQILCGILGTGIVSSAVAVPVLLTRGGQLQTANSAKSQSHTDTGPNWDDFKRECYKLLVEINKGEFIACSGRKNLWEDSALFFLWDISSNKFFPVHQIQKDVSDNQISFLSKNSQIVMGNNGQSFKLKDTQGLQGLVDKSLKDEKCRVNDNKLQCTSGNFTLFEVKSTNFYI